jgi:cell wall-associated NlpC family hydrolase
MDVPMRHNLLVFTSACLLIIIGFSSCHTTKNASLAYKYSRQPKFIKGIYLNGHNKTNATVDAIEPTKVIVKKPTANSTGSATALNLDDTNMQQYTAPVSTTRNSDQENGATFDLVSDNLVQLKYAEMIGLDGKDLTNQQLYRFIDKWYGTNYRFGGQTMEGIDCSGFSQKLYDEVYGLDLTRTAVEQFRNCKRDKNCDHAEEGDLVFFRFRNKKIGHVGVYLANDYFVHASTSQGVTISNLKEEYWQRRYAGIGKVSKEDSVVTKEVSGVIETPTVH